jgi:hypothetical protein
MVALIGGLLAIFVARSTWAAECAADDDRVDFANVTFCVSKANDLYRYTVDEFLGLQFVPQTFIGDERVPARSYYDADGKAPVDGTYITVSIRPPRLSQSDVRQYEGLKKILNDAIEAHPREPVFKEREPGKITFRRFDESTVVASTSVAEDGVLVSEVWLHLDGLGKIEHMLSCEYFIVRPDAFSGRPMECMSWFPVGTSIAKMRLSGGNQERSYRLSRRIRGDIEDFIGAGANP